VVAHSSAGVTLDRVAGELTEAGPAVEEAGPASDGRGDGVASFGFGVGEGGRERGEGAGWLGIEHGLGEPG
jgi:hypothetical protein